MPFPLCVSWCNWSLGISVRLLVCLCLDHQSDIWLHFRFVAVFSGFLLPFAGCLLLVSWCDRSKWLKWVNEKSRMISICWNIKDCVTQCYQWVRSNQASDSREWRPTTSTKDSMLVILISSCWQLSEQLRLTVRDFLGTSLKGMLCNQIRWSRVGESLQSSLVWPEMCRKCVCVCSVLWVTFSVAVTVPFSEVTVSQFSIFSFAFSQFLSGCLFLCSWSH